MSESHRKNLKNLELRAKLPRIIRVASVVLLAVAGIAVVVGFFRARNNTEFRMKRLPASLSKDVIGEISNYERTETDGDLKRYYIRAAKAVTFSDNHQELEDVYLEVYDETATLADRISARKGIYVPAENKNFTAYFAGAVEILTRDELLIRTEQMTYEKASETVEAEELIEFERGNVKGKAVGAFGNIREKTLELMSRVEIDAFALDPADELAKSDVKSARVTADYARIDQVAETIDLTENVFIGIIPSGSGSELSQPTDINASRAKVQFADRAIRSVSLTGAVRIEQKATAANTRWMKARSDHAVAAIDGELKRAEMHDGVEIDSGSADSGPTKIMAVDAIYEKDADRFELHRSVRIVTQRADGTTNITAENAVYEQSLGRIALSGGAEVENGRELVKGDAINALLFPDRSLQSASARGSAYLRQATAERTTEISAPEVSAVFGDDNQLRSAATVGATSATLTPSTVADYSKVMLQAPRAMKLAFRAAGLLERMTTEGRTTIRMNAPAGAADAADKTLTADNVTTVFNPGGRDISRAEAVGNAELIVAPLQASAENYRTAINAPRFDCDFFPTGSNARVCVAQTKTKTVRTPTIQADDRGPQTILADKLTANFDQATQDVDYFDAIGAVRFTELDRNAIAGQMTFRAREKVVQLRGGEPTIWDSRARARADEIDWDTGNQRSRLRGNVSTTYYNQKQTGGATPFTATNKPVFLTSANAEFDHRAETGIYTGNARAWQENNYVRADRILLKQKDGELFADGNVQSVAYSARGTDKMPKPVFAASQKMSYGRTARQLRYEGNVDIRQGTDRVTSGIATILLDENNEMKQTTVENEVVITQPKRRATGNWAQYTNTTDIAVLRGNPATVEDAENGSTQGAQLTVYNKENRVTNESKTSPVNSGRIRSVYKVKKN